jgi:hypothetical protein
LRSAASIVLGKLSGRKAVSTRLEQLGFGLSAEEVNDVFKRFKVRSSAPIQLVFTFCTALGFGSLQRRSTKSLKRLKRFKVHRNTVDVAPCCMLCLADKKKAITDDDLMCLVLPWYHVLVLTVGTAESLLIPHILCVASSQALADKKKAITDDDLMDLVTMDQEQQQGHGQWELGYIQVKTILFFCSYIRW